MQCPCSNCNVEYLLFGNRQSNSLSFSNRPRISMHKLYLQRCHVHPTTFNTFRTLCSVVYFRMFFSLHNKIIKAHRHWNESQFCTSIQLLSIPYSTNTVNWMQNTKKTNGIKINQFECVQLLENQCKTSIRLYLVRQNITLIDMR